MLTEPVPIRVSEIGEFIRFQSCERRFKLGLDNRRLGKSVPSKLALHLRPTTFDRQAIREGLDAALAIAGFQAEGDAAKITRGVPTVGRIANGAIIEREVEFALNRLHQVRPALRNADFTTAKWIAAAINDFIGAPTAEPLDSSTVQINVPRQFTGNVVALLTEIEQLQIEPDLPAKIVIDERSGIIVMGRDEIARTIELVDSKIVNTDERGSGATAAAARMPPKMAPRTTTRAAIIRRTISLPIRMRAR